jgi:hypothetical protein
MLHRGPLPGAQIIDNKNEDQHNARRINPAHGVARVEDTEEVILPPETGVLPFEQLG